MQARRRLWSGTHKDKGKEEGQRGVGREKYEKKPWLLERNWKKLNNSATTVRDGDTLLMPYAPVGAGIAQSVERLSTGWKTKGLEFESR
jgi:hypothetical protein